MSSFKSLLAPAFGFLLLAGCGSSEKPTTPLTTGSTSDPNYRFVSQEVVNDQSFQGVTLGLDLSGSLVDSIPGAVPSRGLLRALPAVENGQLVIESYSYVLQGTWHIFQVSGFVAFISPVDTFDITGVDSIQLMSNEAPILYPDDTMDGFDYRLHFDSWSRIDSDSLAGSHDVSVRLVDSATISANADLAENIHFQHSDSVATCDVSVANSFRATDVLISIDGGGCPLGGTIVLTSAISIDCLGTGGSFSASVDGVWTIRGTYNGVTEDYSITDGTTLWTSSEPCSPASPVSHIW